MTCAWEILCQLPLFFKDSWPEGRVDMNMHVCPKAVVNWRNHHQPEYNFSIWFFRTWVRVALSTIALGILRLIKLTKYQNMLLQLTCWLSYLMGKIIFRKTNHSCASVNTTSPSQDTFYLSSGLSPVSEEELLINNIWFQHSMVSGYHSLSNVQINL